MQQLDTIIFSHEGKFFRFKKIDDAYICDICYWKGIVKKSNEGWTAEIEQKFAPFDHDMIGSLPTAESGMQWISSNLIKKEA